MRPVRNYCTIRIILLIGILGVMKHLTEQKKLQNTCKSTLDQNYLERAKELTHKVIKDFGDEKGGFYLYGKDSEELILKPKETYDGAIPSGNSLMAYNFVRLSLITSDEKFIKEAKKQLDFISRDVLSYPPGYAMFLISLSEQINPPVKVTIVPDENFSKENLLNLVEHDTIVILLEGPTEQYLLKDGKTTYYVCTDKSCLPPTNELKT